MRELTKAQLTIGILACFSIGIGSVNNVMVSSSQIEALGWFVAQLVAVFILSFILLAILKWVDIFDLKTNAVLTLLVLAIPLLLL